ncbi:lipid-transfer protein [Solimonas terrae]|uniref:propanoyl-CoA C-acyltransferase n=1 Tax=Solimonas terrae TaxID=1396819 RepID=A0A6M2BMF2_9GAMM|nr:lipid-transfer protein [Solimonas terrae]
MPSRVIVAGVGMIPFTKPGACEPYDVMGATAAVKALDDAGLHHSDIQQAIVGYVYGDSTCGQAAVYRVGMSGIPIINVNNNCSTGSSALFMARQLVESGAAECVLALGFEQMRPGALEIFWNDRPSPFSRFDSIVADLLGQDAPLALKYFGGAGKEYMDRYGAKPELFAKVRAKASRHAANNPLALFRKVVTDDEVMASPMVFPHVGMTRLMACPPTCGAAAAILVSEEFARKRGLDHRVAIVAQAMTTDRAEVVEQPSLIGLVGAGMTRDAARQVYQRAGVGPEDIDVIELHDCFAQNEVLTYEALGLCPEGGAEKFVADGDNTYGGRYVTNPSGGLLSKGHPLGATGLAQCTELVQQLRGRAEARQVEGAKLALQHNLGLGGACVVTLYQRAA